MTYHQKLCLIIACSVFVFYAASFALWILAL